MQFTIPGLTDITSQDDLVLLLNSSNVINNIKYLPNRLENVSPHPRLKISQKAFTNVSFSKTVISCVDFTYCHFENCLFIGTTITECDFQQCSFKNINTHKIIFLRTYINPSLFRTNYSNVSEANLAVHLFQQLLNNSQDNEQRQFARIANFNFLKWKGKLSWNKFINRQPYPINFWDFLKDGIPNYIYRFTFGYGLRLRNFFYTFIMAFILFYTLNYIYWKDYVLSKKDLTIECFKPSEVSLTANFFYTVDITTKIIDSQFQPSSTFGMFMLTVEGVTGFVFFSFLITILVNKFVK